MNLTFDEKMLFFPWVVGVQHPYQTGRWFYIEGMRGMFVRDYGLSGGGIRAYIPCPPSGPTLGTFRFVDEVDIEVAIHEQRGMRSWA